MKQCVVEANDESLLNSVIVSLAILCPTKRDSSILVSLLGHSKGFLKSFTTIHLLVVRFIWRSNLKERLLVMTRLSLSWHGSLCHDKDLHVMTWYDICVAQKWNSFAHSSHAFSFRNVRSFVWTLVWNHFSGWFHHVQWLDYTLSKRRCNITYCHRLKTLMRFM